MLKAESEVLFERRAVLSQKVLDHGRALMTPLLEQIKDEGRNDPHKAQFKKPIDMFELAIDLEPKNTEAKEELEKGMVHQVAVAQLMSRREPLAGF